MPEPKYRRKLNTEQLDVLKLLYKFRFGSNELIAQYFGKKDRSFVFKRMKVLQEQGLIGKRFESSYRIKGKPAGYYLLPEGARALQAYRPDISVNIKPIYKDKMVSEEFVEYCLLMLGLYCRFKARYGDGLKFITKSQLAGYGYFSEFVPSAYIRREIDGVEEHYFLEYLQSSKPFFTVVQKLKQYIEYADSGEWEDGTNSQFPTVLLVCERVTIQRRLLKSSAKILEDAADDLKFCVSTVGGPEWYDLDANDEIKAPLELFASPS